MKFFCFFKDKKKYYLICIPILVVVLGFLTVHTVIGGSPEPGSSEDPLVSKSYVDSEIKKVTAEMNAKINQLQSGLSQIEKSKDNDEVLEAMAAKIFELSKAVSEINKQLDEYSKYIKFEVVEMEPGQKLILGESAEIILRSGKALAIAGINGDGLADITTDSKQNELITDSIVPVNHLILAARDDGRGIKAVTKISVLVKGDYKIIGIDGEEIEEEMETEEITEEIIEESQTD